MRASNVSRPREAAGESFVLCLAAFTGTVGGGTGGTVVYGTYQISGSLSREKIQKPPTLMYVEQKVLVHVRLSSMWLFSSVNNTIDYSPLLPLRQNLEAAGLGCLVSHLDVWKGSTVAGPLPWVDGGRTMEIYLQRWPADKKVSDTCPSLCRYHSFLWFLRVCRPGGDMPRSRQRS